MHPKDTNRLANSVDPGLIWVCTVCPDLSARIFRIITVSVEQIRRVFHDNLGIMSTHNICFNGEL